MKYKDVPLYTPLTKPQGNKIYLMIDKGKEKFRLIKFDGYKWKKDKENFYLNDVEAWDMNYYIWPKLEVLTDYYFNSQLVISKLFSEGITDDV